MIAKMNAHAGGPHSSGGAIKFSTEKKETMDNIAPYERDAGDDIEIDDFVPPVPQGLYPEPAVPELPGWQSQLLDPPVSTEGMCPGGHTYNPIDGVCYPF